VESDDGRWIRAEAIQPQGDESLSGEAGPGENDGWPAPVAGPSAGKRWGHGGIPGFSAWAAAAVAVVAAAAGVAVGLFLIS
jgi:hypothetical protein